MSRDTQTKGEEPGSPEAKNFLMAKRKTQGKYPLFSMIGGLFTIVTISSDPSNSVTAYFIIVLEVLLS